MTNHTGSTLYFRIIFKALRRYGIDRDGFLSTLGTSMQAIIKQGNRQPVKTIIEYWQEAAKITHNPMLGLECGTLAQAADYGLMAPVWMSSTDLRMNVQFMHDYKQLMCENFISSLESKSDHTIYTLLVDDLTPDQARHLVEFDFSSVLYLGYSLVDDCDKQSVCASEIHFVHSAASDQQYYEKAFNCLVKFNQTANRMIIPNKTLDLPIHTPNKILREAITRVLDDTVKHELDCNLQQQVTHHLKQHLGKKFPNATETANCFGYSLSAFKRALHQEGVNFQLPCTEVKKTSARQLLLHTDTSIEDIALLLDFAETTAFHKAFKRWYQLTPFEYRKQNK